MKKRKSDQSKTSYRDSNSHENDSVPKTSANKCKVITKTPEKQAKNFGSNKKRKFIKKIGTHSDKKILSNNDS